MISLGVGGLFESPVLFRLFDEKRGRDVKSALFLLSTCKIEDRCHVMDQSVIMIRRTFLGDWMRFLHTADWHIGKKLQGYDLIEDQRHVLSSILDIAKEEKVEAIVIAGDLYDRSVPAVDAVALYNELIVDWNLKERIPIFAISGNHDSSTRLSAGTPWFSYSNYFLRTQLAEAFEPVEFNNIQFFFLPYFEPIAARLYFEDDSIRTIQQAVAKVIDKMEELFDSGKKHVLISHFFVMGSVKSDSETKIEVGGLDSIPGELLAPFDYVALGHLHNQAALRQDNARYSGSPLKFSLSEINQKKAYGSLIWQQT